MAIIFMKRENKSMATVYLTSSPTGPLDGSREVKGLDKMNGFVEKLKSDWVHNARVLIISATPDDYVCNDEMLDFFFKALLTDGFSVVSCDVLDERNADMTKEEIQAYDVIFLAGGHVPTQNAFFINIGLKGKLQGYNGIIIGISAGSMNCADVVYCPPEEPGEASNPEYQHFLIGLGLTKTMISPHYQMVKNHMRDGKRLYSDIVLVDSLWNGGQAIYSLCDGSYLYQKNGEEVIYGETWITKNGDHWKLCSTDEYKMLK